MSSDRRKTQHRLPAGPAEPASGFVASTALRFGEQLRHHLRKLLRRPQDVDDVSQEVYLRLLRVKNMQHVQDPLEFIRTVATHVVQDLDIGGEIEEMPFDERPEEDREESLDPDGDDDLPSFEGEPLASNHDEIELHQLLAHLIAELPRQQREVLLLAYREGYRYKEVARILDISEPMVHKHLNHAKARLRELGGDS